MQQTDCGCTTAFLISFTLCLTLMENCQILCLISRSYCNSGFQKFMTPSTSQSIHHCLRYVTKTSLDHLFQVLCENMGVSPSELLHEDSKAYGNTDPDADRFHEAGYDAFVTGFVFLVFHTAASQEWKICGFSDLQLDSPNNLLEHCN